MATITSDLEQYTQSVAQHAHEASLAMAGITGQQKTDWLIATAASLLDREDEILSENEKDILQAPEYGLTEAAIDRLRLDRSRLAKIGQALHEIAALPEPIGEIIDSSVRPNGLLVSRVRSPLGVIFFIYESRPNVTIDAAALCVKSGNAVILRGGKEAFYSNQAFHRVLKDQLIKHEIPADAVQMVETTDREAVGHFLSLNELISVTIPRGGKSLIERVAQEATMPVIKHFDGNCHVYVHEDADLQMAQDITINSKCQRPGVCNAAESILIDESIAEAALPQLLSRLHQEGVTVYGCEKTCDVNSQVKPASEEDYAREYLALEISCKVVSDLNEAISHINRYSSQHTEAIVTNNLSAAQTFTQLVDSSAVVVNASTRFNDGGEFGLGAEIGISTDKLHARGPCGLKELTSYKYIVQGSGQTRQ